MTNSEIDKYFKILCPSGIPAFIEEYSNVPEMLRLKGVGLFCGTDYNKIYNHRYFYSRFEHSIAVALLIWQFTGNEKQSLAGLFHDIATPIFSHSVDFMNGDALTQTSTEERTHATIKNSSGITKLLARDCIDLCNVDDYHLYPIADNDSPRLSADRLEYTLSTMLVWQGKWKLPDIKGMLDYLTILKNEVGQDELGFCNLESAEKFVAGSCLIGEAFARNENKLSLNFLGDILKECIKYGLLTIDDLYTLTENEVISILSNTSNKQIQTTWKAYTQLESVYSSENKPIGYYFVNIDTKKRYINPLIKLNGEIKRSTLFSERANKTIDSFLLYSDKPYGYINLKY